MKIKYIVFFLFLLQFTSPGILFSQGERRFDPLKDDIAGKIPPLSVLIDSATANNHAVRSKSLQVIVDNCKLKAARAEWTRNLGIQANMGYGNLYNYSSNSSPIRELWPFQLQGGKPHTAAPSFLTCRSTLL
ncbi:MAG: hypothetical protein WCK34_15830 [Bacteroidota bacterium]